MSTFFKITVLAGAAHLLIIAGSMAFVGMDEPLPAWVNLALAGTMVVAIVSAVVGIFAEERREGHR